MTDDAVTDDADVVTCGLPGKRNGRVIGAIKTSGEEEIMLISNSGTLVRTPADDISILGRNTQGVTLIRLGDGEQLVQIEPVAASVDDKSASDD